MTPEQFVEEIKDSCWGRVSVKIGRINGEPVFHIRDIDARTSSTIRNLGEWLVHPQNKRNRPPRQRAEKEETWTTSAPGTES